MCPVAQTRVCVKSAAVAGSRAVSMSADVNLDAGASLDARHSRAPRAPSRPAPPGNAIHSGSAGLGEAAPPCSWPKFQNLWVESPCAIAWGIAHWVQVDSLQRVLRHQFRNHRFQVRLNRRQTQLKIIIAFRVGLASIGAHREPLGVSLEDMRVGQGRFVFQISGVIGIEPGHQTGRILLFAQLCQKAGQGIEIGCDAGGFGHELGVVVSISAGPTCTRTSLKGSDARSSVSWSSLSESRYGAPAELIHIEETTASLSGRLCGLRTGQRAGPQDQQPQSDQESRLRIHSETLLSKTTSIGARLHKGKQGGAGDGPFNRNAIGAQRI